MSQLSRFFRLFSTWETRIEGKIDRLAYLVENILMSKLEDLVTSLNDETNAIAARLDKLQTDLQTAITGGQAPKPETLAALDAISARLKSLGSDPAHPIPAEPATTSPGAPQGGQGAAPGGATTP